MTKKIVFIFSLFIMCGTDSSAHNIGDYVIAEYVKLYIEKKTDTTWRNRVFPKEWQMFENNSIQNPLSQSELEAVIEKLPTSPLNDSKEIIREKTENFYSTIKSFSDKTNLKEIIIGDVYVRYFNDRHTSLQKKLEKEINNYYKANSSFDTFSNNNLSQSEEEKDKGTSIWWLLWIAFGFTVVIIVWKYRLKKMH